MYMVPSFLPGPRKLFPRNDRIYLKVMYINRSNFLRFPGGVHISTAPVSASFSGQHSDLIIITTIIPFNATYKEAIKKYRLLLSP